MAAKGTTTFWGTEEEEENKYTEKKMRLLGACMAKEINDDIREEMQKMPIFITAREYIQHKVDEEGETKLSAPQSEEGTPPEMPNVYTDGSLHSPTSRHWQDGGMGICWPQRELQKEPLE